MTPALALPGLAREELCQWMSSLVGALGRFMRSLWAWAVPASADLEGGRGYLLAACRCWQAVSWGRRAVFCLCRPRALQGHRPVHKALTDASCQPGGPRSEPQACSKPCDPGAALGQAPWSQKSGPQTWLGSGARAAPEGTEAAAQAEAGRPLSAGQGAWSTGSKSCSLGSGC